MTKSEIRNNLLQIRNNLNNKHKLSQDICNKLLEHISKHYPNSKIASFVSLINEVNTTTINNSLTTYLPIVHPHLKHCMWFAKDTGQYYLNKYKIKEPIHNAKDIIAPWELDLVIVPIVGFNQNKYRMGMGGGFYDYSFSFKKNTFLPITIGIAFDEQQNNDIIVDNHDIQLDLIITPTRIL
ncbi:5-formyltetrahydrofolate cyclo-ligase [Francisella adeliensis]|uniref:5-formyltetrahydrofolate cyclo-ligase n=1 Tax=Francisella adeliensis TaxID=2007306 RepID=A0A2Z4XYW5_9GAMM|nr:5-formyltetrahydrofolate cyclo-ligase [Francisella adeliensis]AXA33672.1 5-formyltetrahydrofolate cyclo-ligase [Francisella adeliensis]MBK2085564.1 5-formyltetrahydrofolate cyclo-ligase [Francisella adeliensis]MBK2097442.1 5-formyltetrahydrofolate cyclo-ligase [Francisella adeliensis]QIW11905.1 5-formyltetrahydrofolate cyclo-ligase [Francisella adeliensis]QIW13781.1 5-formyltetrahydrofolate cyclo-ligase [Francisella adeliensis]